MTNSAPGFASRLGKHITNNFKIYLLFFLFMAVGYFDASRENLFLTENFRLPYLAIAFLVPSFIYSFIYANGKLCPTQSFLYRRLGLPTLGFFFTLIFVFYAMRDPAKGQLLIYSIGIYAALMLYYRKDDRLGKEEGSEELIAAVKEERKEVKLFIYPFLLTAIILQSVFYFYVNKVFQLYFNPFLQLACGLTLTNLGLIFLNTRLDYFKRYLLILEVITLVLALIYFCIFGYLTLDIFSVDSVVNSKYLLSYFAGIAYLAFLNLGLSFCPSLFKGWLGAGWKLASLITYLALILASYNIVYY